MQFGGVFDGDDALVLRNESGKHIQQRGLASASPARDENVQPPLHHAGEHFQHGFGQSLIFDHVARGHRIAPESPNREYWTIQSERRDDGIYTGAIGQARVHHGRTFVYTAAYARNNAVDDLHQMLVVFEAEPRYFQAPRTFDVNLVVAIDQNVGNGGIGQQRLERAQAEDLIQHLFTDLLPL